MTKEVKDKTIYLKNRKIGFRVSIPDTFVEVKKEMYPKLGVDQNTLNLFNVDRRTTFSVSFVGFASPKDFEGLNKFNASKFNSDDLALLASEKETHKAVNAYTYYIQKQNKKIKQTIILVNDMLINFSINFDHKNMLKEIKEFKKCKESNLLDEILKSILIFTPVNPPIAIEEEIPEPIIANEKVIETKSMSQTIVETECKYRGIKVPAFYFKYNYFKNGEVVLLTTIDKELYFSGFRDSFVVVDNGDLSIKLKDIVHKYLDRLMPMDIANKRPSSNSSIVAKAGDKYLYIDLEGELDKATLNEFFIELLSIFEDGNIDGNEIFPAGLFTASVKESVSSSKFIVNDEDILGAVIIDEPYAENPVIEIAEEATSETIDEVVPAEVRDELSEELLLPVIEEEIKTEAIVSSTDSRLVTPELKVLASETEEIFHFMSDAPIFSYRVPSEYAHKLVREFNVFDLENEEHTSLRIFMFPCDTKEIYDAKVEDWMSKNVASAGGLIESKLELLISGEEVKNFLLANDKFYKISYQTGYLIAISATISPELLSVANYILNNSHQIKASPGYIEAFERKLRSIAILKEEGIDYLMELPLIENSVDAHKKTVDKIARRAIALCISANFAIDVANGENKKQLKSSKKFFTKLLDTYKVKQYLTNNEKNLFDKMDQNLAIQISWQFEGLVVLFWALKLIEDIPYPKELINPKVLSSILSESNSYIEFINKCNLRSIDEILDLADLTYRYDWYCVDARINDIDIDSKINSEVVLERHRALNWLIQDVDWDNVNIDT